ncbi:MAG TPA: DMT family transporter [Xanthobacteraceae bacterium]|nr:DMT family transporter [Xanthobacteraceae bacterium]
MIQFFRRLFDRLYNAPYVLLVSTMLFWAGNATLGRYAAGYFPPVALGTLRWAIAALILLPFAWPYLRADWPVIRKNVWMLTALSLLSISAYNTLSYYGLQYTEVVNSVILQSVGTPLVLVFTFLIYGDKISFRQAAGILIAFAGIMLIVSRGELSALLEYRFNAGDFILLLAIAAYSLYSALLKRRPPLHPLSFVTLTMGWGAILLLPFYAAEIATGYTVPLEPRALLILAYVVIFPSLLAHFFFFRGVELIGPNRAAPTMYTIPVLASLMAIFFLGERLYPFHIAGFALVLAGVVLATRQPPAAAPAEVKT